MGYELGARATFNATFALRRGGPELLPLSLAGGTGSFQLGFVVTRGLWRLAGSFKAIARAGSTTYLRGLN